MRKIQRNNVRWVGHPTDWQDAEKNPDAESIAPIVENIEPRRVRAMPIGFHTARGPDCVDAQNGKKRR